MPRTQLANPLQGQSSKQTEHCVCLLTKIDVIFCMQRITDHELIKFPENILKIILPTTHLKFIFLFNNFDHDE